MYYYFPGRNEHQRRTTGSHRGAGHRRSEAESGREERAGPGLRGLRQRHESYRDRSENVRPLPRLSEAKPWRFCTSPRTPSLLLRIFSNLLIKKK